MKKRVVCAAVILVAVSALGLGACAPASTTSVSPTTATATTAPPTTTQPPTQPVSEAPKYGGVVTRIEVADVRAWDDLKGNHLLWNVHPVQQRLLIGDWTRGPSGTGELDFSLSECLFDTKMGQLAESWEVFPAGRFVYKIREDIHYWLDPNNEASRLVNGRELTADDIAYSLNRLIKTKGSYINNASPQMSAVTKVTAVDKYTLEVDTGSDWALEGHYFLAFYGYGDTAREVIAKYGDYANWKNVVGTGPFIVTDFVPGSSVTMIRNSKYFARDPVGPGKGNQLPYLDGVKFLIIPDPSTRLAALRTAKADFMSAVELDDARSLIRTDQPIMYKQGHLGAASTVNMRTDKAELPYKDIKVRQALMYATDFDSINKTLCGGLGILPSWPVVYQKELPGFYLSMKELPEEVQGLYRYNPEKAKQLLAEAGYANGFKAEIIVSAAAPYPDEVSIFKDMWAKVGVELVLQLKESSVFSSIQTARSHPDMIYGTTSNTGLMFPRGYGTVSGNTFANTSMIDQEYIEKARLASQQAWLKGDYREQWRITREDLLPRVLFEAWAIPFPQKPSFAFWWPWLKNFYGATNPGAFTGAGYQYMWIDQDLKGLMTGRR